MYGYLDESIVYINGKRYLFLGMAVFKLRPKENVINREFSKTKSPLRNKEEIKYINTRNERIKQEVLAKIKSECLYFDTDYLEITPGRNMHSMVNLLISMLLFRFEKVKQTFNIKLMYDKATYEIKEKEIYSNFYFVSQFEFKNSLKEIGIQYVDWIVGEAGETFTQKQKA